MQTMNVVSVFLIYIIFSFKRHEVICEPTAMFKGCFQDGGATNRLFIDDNEDFSMLTQEVCNKYCLEKGFAYAGTLDGFKCFCSEVKPPDSKKVADSKCNISCSGDITKKCGGRNKLTVFFTGAPEPTGLGQRHRRVRTLVWRLTTRRLPDPFYGLRDPFDGLFDIYDARPRTTILFIRRGDSGWKSVGCFNDTRDKIFYGPQQVPYVTNNKCMKHCSQKGYNYAGTESGSQCFCANQRPKADQELSPDKCKMRCIGDQSQDCGGVWGLSVYSNSEPSVTGNNPGDDNDDDDDDDVLNWSNIGCFKDSSNRIFPDHKEDFRTSLTDQNCIKHCSKKSFDYAGIQFGEQCFCGNQKPSALLEVNSEECNMRCSGDREKNCGGVWRMTVYAKTVTVPGGGTEVLKPVGCFKDARKNRVLPARINGIPGLLTSQKCIKECAQREYLYAGTENGNYCFCGSTKPKPNREVGMEECNVQCPGDQSENCGGEYRLAVYSTNDTPSTTATPPTDQMPQKPIVQTPHKSTVQPTPKSTVHTTPKSAVQTTPKSTVQTTPKSTVQTPQKSCDYFSKTLVNRAPVCSGEVIFDEQFSSGLGDRWKHDIMLSDDMELGYAVFNSDSKNIYTTANGLTIKPTVINDIFVEQGSLNLKGCTGTSPQQCSHQAEPGNILPPVESAKIHTRDSFSFRYGIVEIRAKLPQGDWLVPELWLEPLNHTYGPAYESGRLRLAMNRGNANFMCNGEDFGTNLLESGVVMGPTNNVRIRSLKTNLPADWHSNFHNYILKWTPEIISFKIDSEPPQELFRDSGKSLCEVVGFKSNECLQSNIRLNIAPFEQDFYIKLGLSVGNARDFPDDCTNSGKPKPWKNSDEKPMLKFWQDRKNWKATWTEENSALYIEHVRVTAL